MRQTGGARDEVLSRKGRSNAKFGSYLVGTDWSLCCERDGSSSNILQGLRGAAKSVHEELRRAGLQDRVPNVPEILQVE